ncbi:MAG: prolipoprotein diacylglyceryl transferase [Myxococcales bacterium]|nr:prolipoprotein diacylglyceryl transferase [Myxococcales bacterium]MCB9643350.1 prolipoprotein diacylglyceryl transferase [Myxococcales bacterium]
MHPILLDYKLPASFFKMWGPNQWLSQKLSFWIVGLVVSGVIAWWGLAPNASKGRRVPGWLGTVAALCFAVILGGVGTGRLSVIKLHTYGVLVAIGFLLGIILAVREARRVGEDPERILDLAFWLLLAAMVGARLFYVVIHWGDFVSDFSSKAPWYTWKVFRLWEGGLLFYGGLTLALLVSVAFTRLSQVNFWKMADIIIPSVALGQFFGLLGSFAAGFGFGKPTSAAWGVSFPSHPVLPAELPAGVALHPTQLYEALAVLAIFFVLLWVRSAKRYHGQVFVWYLLVYPVVSFFLDMFRGDDKRGLIMSYQKDITAMAQGADILSWSQLSAVVFFVLALALFSMRQAKEAAK